jgi:hypothetical protein
VEKRELKAMKKNENDLEDTCPFPPGVDLPRKGRFTSIYISIFTDTRFVASVLLLAGIIFIFGLTLAPPPIIQLQTNPPIWNATIPQAKQYSLYEDAEPWTPRYLDVRTWEGDLVLEGDQVLVIENCTFLIQGSVLVKDHAKLVLKNVDLNIKQKTSWIPTDLLPPGYNVMFKDESEFQTDHVRANAKELVFYNSSTCHVTDSNMSKTWFFGYDDTSFSFKKALINWVSIGENASAHLNDCKVNYIFPATIDNWSHETIKTGNLKLDAEDSSIISLWTLYLNSTIKVDKPTSGYYESWNSFTDLAPGGKGFNITLTRSSFSGLTISSEGSYLEIINSNDLDYAYNRWGQVKVVNSSLHSLASGGGGIIDGCRIGMINLIDGDYEVSRSRIFDLFLHHNHGTVNLTQVKAGRITGHDFNCSLVGDLNVENDTVTIIHGYCQATRRYPVQVLNGDRAAVGVDLRLFNSTGFMLWSGKTDNIGAANVDITFYRKEYTRSSRSPEFADTLRLVASGTSGEKEVQLKFTSNTPVIFVFPTESGRPMWAQGWFIETVSVVIAIFIVIMFVYEKVRKRGVS